MSLTKLENHGFSDKPIKLIYALKDILNIRKGLGRWAMLVLTEFVRQRKNVCGCGGEFLMTALSHCHDGVVTSPERRFKQCYKRHSGNVKNLKFYLLDL